MDSLCVNVVGKGAFKYRTDSIKQAVDAQDKDFCLELAANGLHF